MEPRLNMPRLVPMAALAVLLTISGCATQQKVESETAPAPTDTGATVTPLPADDGTQGQAMDTGAIDAVGRVVYFDYDRDDIKPEYRQLIATHAEFLRQNPQAKVKLGGHADERGSREYNLALSERRAKAVLNQLMLAGVSESQMKTAAYGEEYPAVQGHGETSWSKNRRVEFDYQGSAERAVNP